MYEQNDKEKEKEKKHIRGGRLATLGAQQSVNLTSMTLATV